MGVCPVDWSGLRNRSREKSDLKVVGSATESVEDSFKGDWLETPPTLGY